MKLTLIPPQESPLVYSVMPGTLRIRQNRNAITGSCTVYCSELPAFVFRQKGEGAIQLRLGGLSLCGVLLSVTLTGRPPQAQFRWQGRAAE